MDYHAPLNVKQASLQINVSVESHWSFHGSLMQSYPRKRRSFLEWLLRKPKKVIDYRMDAELLVDDKVVSEASCRAAPKPVATLFSMDLLTPGIHWVRLRASASPDVRLGPLKVIAMAHYR